MEQFQNNHHQASYDQNDFFVDKSGCIEWSPFATSSLVNGIAYSFSGAIIDDGALRWH